VASTEISSKDMADPATGIVWTFRFNPDGIGEYVPNNQVDAALVEPGPGWIWVYLALADVRCRNWIAQHAPVSELAREVLAGPDTHLRLESLGTELAGVVPDLHQEFAQPGDDLVRLRFVMTERIWLALAIALGSVAVSFWALRRMRAF
jgi:zinc transporter